MDGQKLSRLTMTLEAYIDHLPLLMVTPKPNQGADEPGRWIARVAAIKKRQRAYGLIGDLKNWVKRQGYKRLGDALPN